MPIRPFLNQAAFDPEVISAMSHALDTACQALEARNGQAVNREIMAKKIVEVASGGECDAARLRDAALNAVAGDNSDLALLKYGIPDRVVYATPQELAQFFNGEIAARVNAGTVSHTKSRIAVTDQPFHLTKQPVKIDGLGVEVITACSQRPLAVARHGMRAERDDWNPRRLRIGF